MCDPITLVLALLCDAAIAFFAVLHWRDQRRRNPALRLHLRLMDLWGAMLGLSVSLWVFTLLLKASDETRIYAIPALVLVIPHQLAGIFIYATNFERGESVHSTSSLRSFARIAGGALLGMVLPGFSIVLVLGFFIFLLLLPVIGPMLLILRIAGVRPGDDSETR